MRELDLLEQYLLRLRQDRIQQGHQRALTMTADTFIDAKVAAHEAQLCDQVLRALKELKKDPGEFIKQYLRREQ